MKGRLRMDDIHKKKLIVTSMIVLLVAFFSCFSVLYENNFSIEYVKLVINTFVPILLGLGWVIYFSVKNQIKFVGDLVLKFKVTIIGAFIIIALFLILYVILGTNPQLLFNN